MNSINDIVYLKLSAQRALWGHVFSQLRAVSVNVNENEIDVRFYHDGELSEENEEYCELATTEIIADYPYYFNNKKPQTEFNTPIIRLDYPAQIPPHGHWVYFRHENPSSYFQRNLSGAIWNKTIWPIPIYLVKLSLLNALLGRVSQCLRSVCFNINEKDLTLVFYYDGEINETDYELYKLVVNEVQSEFESSSHKLTFNFSIERVDFPEHMPLIGHWAYYRAENTNL